MTTLLAEKSWRVQDELELVGIDLWQASWMDLNFTALDPVRARVECDCDDDECDGCRIAWDRLLLVDRPSRDASKCLLDFLTLEHASANDILAFVERWGTPDWGYDADPGEIDREGWFYLDDVRTDAHLVELLLRTMVATEDGELVDLEWLQFLWEATGGYGGDSCPEHDEFQTALKAMTTELVLETGTSGRWREAYESLKEQTWHRWRESERRQGAGLDYQRQLVTTFLLTWANAAYALPKWDGARRSVTSEVVGFKDLVGAQLRQVFAAPVLDVYTCSICRRSFMFEDGDSNRRPRRGARRFCGPACQDSARKESNRASWQRNKDRWRKGAQTVGTGDET